MHVYQRSGTNIFKTKSHLWKTFKLAWNLHIAYFLKVLSSLAEDNRWVSTALGWAFWWASSGRSRRLLQCCTVGGSFDLFLSLIKDLVWISIPWHWHWSAFSMKSLVKMDRIPFFVQTYSTVYRYIQYSVLMFFAFWSSKVEGLVYDFFQRYLSYPDPLDRRNGMA